MSTVASSLTGLGTLSSATTTSARANARRSSSASSPAAPSAAALMRTRAAMLPSEAPTRISRPLRPAGLAARYPGRRPGSRPRSFAPRPLTPRVMVNRLTVAPVAASARETAAAAERPVSSAITPTRPSPPPAAFTAAAPRAPPSRRWTATPFLVCALKRRSVSTGAKRSGSGPSTTTALHFSISAMPRLCSAGSRPGRLSSWWSMWEVPSTSRARRWSSHSSSLVLSGEPITPMAPAPSLSLTPPSWAAAAATAASVVTTVPARSSRLPLTSGWRILSVEFHRGKEYRPSSQSHMSSTSGLSREAKRRTSKSRESTLTLQP